MMNQTGIPLIALGFILGIRHSLDVDHLAAVSTLVTGPRGKIKSAIVGMYWGLGHSISLMVMGGAIVWLDVRFSPEVAHSLEALVGVMLIYLGGRVFYRLARGGVFHVHAHGHGERVHLHPHIHDAGIHHAVRSDNSHHHKTQVADRSGRTSFIVGMVHGLAGSAGLTLLLLPSMPSRVMGLVYLGVFGVGSIFGMALSTFLLSIPLGMLGSSESAVIHNTGGRARKIVTCLGGLLCLAIGIVLLWESGGPLFLS